MNDHTVSSADEPDADEEYSDELETAGTETEDDIADVKDIDFRDVVLAPSDWTVKTILSQLGDGSFELDPDFQRRNAWSVPRKSKFIESLMVGLPIPQIVFAEKEDEDGSPSYVVIDGKQRLLTLQSFQSTEDPLKLAGLTVLPAERPNKGGDSCRPGIGTLCEADGQSNDSNGRNQTMASRLVSSLGLSSHQSSNTAAVCARIAAGTAAWSVHQICRQVRGS